MVWEKLLSPLNLGSQRTRNRVAFCAHRTNLAGKGEVSEALAAYYWQRAQGGCGLIVVGELTLHPSDRPYQKMIQIQAGADLSGLKDLVRQLHQQETLLLAQLNHRGFQSHGLINRRPVWGPGALADVVHGEVSQPMDQEEIQELTGAFAQAAVRLREIGFDGLEVSLGSESLLRQFLSPLSNHRQDDYGGELTGRLRFPLEVLGAVRKAVGRDFPLGVELCLDEVFYGALSLEESLSAAQEIEKQGLADFFNTAIGTYYNLYLTQASMHHPPGLTLDKAAALKEAVSLPVMAGNRIRGPEEAEETLATGKADLIGWVRPLICDPELPNKIVEGRAGEITRCVYDNQGCVGRSAADRSVGCIQNPWAGRELDRPAARPSSSGRSKRVVVIGAGPGGLAAGLALAEAGHEVAIYEREAVPGGQLRLARLGAGRAEIGGVIDNLVRGLERLETPILTGREMDEESILAETPDGLILATGSFPRPRPVPGDYGPPGVLNVWQALDQSQPVGERVLLIDEDGGHRATATAEFLAGQGKQVDILTSELFIGLDLAPTGDLFGIRQRLLAGGVRFICDKIVSQVQGSKVTAVDKFSGEVAVYDDYQTIVLVMGNQPDDRLYQALKGRLPAVFRVGDCVAPRKIDAAIREGSQVALKI
ncbi:MAG: FAD-dependent oxidoreductase [Deltaproteobacteria bacterium]|nr:FAD-dependent oxidoreductase [Deltaproteobacteria bacterium]